MIKTCKDCTNEGRTGPPLKAPFPGPRCYRHHHARRKITRKRSSEKNQEARYGITPEDYEAMMVAQDGKCALCGRRIGVKRRAAVDHDHSCEVCGGSGCRECVRG